MSVARNWTKTKWEWACQNKLFWANLGLLVLTVVFVLNTGPSDFVVRMWSLTLQLIGAYVVLLDLTGGAKDFGLPSIIKSNIAWLKQGLGIRTVHFLSASGSSMSSSSSSGRLKLVPGGGSNSLEDRVARLEQHVRILDEESDHTHALILQKERELLEKVKTVRADLERSIAATNERLKTAVVGNYAMLLFGAFWVAIGTILSALAPEISRSLSGEWGFCPLQFDNIDALKFRFFS